MRAHCSSPAVSDRTHYCLSLLSSPTPPSSLMKYSERPSLHNPGGRYRKIRRLLQDVAFSRTIGRKTQKWRNYSGRKRAPNFHCAFRRAQCIQYSSASSSGSWLWLVGRRARPPPARRRAQSGKPKLYMRGPRKSSPLVPFPSPSAPNTYISSLPLQSPVIFFSFHFWFLLPAAAAFHVYCLSAQVSNAIHHLIDCAQRERELVRTFSPLLDRKPIAKKVLSWPAFQLSSLLPFFLATGRPTTADR